MGGGLSSARLGNSVSIDSSDSIILESQSVNKSGTVAIVYDIIIDDSHPLATNSSLIGAIKFRKKNNIITDVSQLPIAYPFDKNFKNIPIINESVEIHESSPGLYFYKRITQEFNPTISAVKNAISNNFIPEQPSIGFSDDDIKNVEVINKHFKNKPDNIVKTYSTAGGAKKEYK